MKIFLTFFFLFNAQLLFAEEISDYQIERMSIGDSLLDYMPRDEIIQELKVNEFFYDYLEQGKFGEVYLYENFKTYDHVSFFVKVDDEKYIIYGISGTKYYDDKISECYLKIEEMEKIFSNTYNNAEKTKGTSKFPESFDPSGKSNSKWINFQFDSKDSISLECYQYEKSLKIKNTWSDALVVSIQKKELTSWLSNY